MKNLGFVRKIDKLGRIVIPKEMRNVLHIDIGTPLEFYVNDEGIILKKYTPDNISEKVRELKSIVNEQFEEIGFNHCMMIVKELNNIEQILNESIS